MSSCDIESIADDVLEDRNMYKSLTVFRKYLSFLLYFLRQLYYTVKIYYRMKCKFPNYMHIQTIRMQDRSWEEL